MLEFQGYGVLVLVIVILSLIPIGRFIIQKYSKAKIDNYFNKRLEDHKHELSLVTEAERFNYQRKIQDFSLFTTKKHEHYAELYHLLLVADGEIQALYYEPRSVLTFSGYIRKDISLYLKQQKFPLVKIRSILDLWDTEKETAIKEVEKYLGALAVHRAERSWREAKRYFWRSQIYLSDEVIKVSQSLISDLFELFLYHKDLIFGQQRGAEWVSRSREIKNSLDRNFGNIIKLIRNELGVGYYEQEFLERTHERIDKDLIT